MLDICHDAPTHQLVATMMSEAQGIAHKLDIKPGMSVDQRIAAAEGVGPHKTSMLQDIEAGREPELQALVGSIVELGKLTHTPTPTIDTIYALAGLLARSVASNKPGAGK